MTSDVVKYEASISAVPYAGHVIPHLVRHLEDTLSAVVDAHCIVLGLDNDVMSGPEFDTLTVHIRFNAASEAEASAITREAAEKVGTSDEHWRIVGEPSVRALGDGL